MTDLGTLPGGTISGAFGINTSGQVTGFSDGTGFGQHAFLYSSGVMTDLGTLPGGTSAVGRAINTSGQVTGDSDGFGFVDHAFLYSSGVMSDLGTLPGGIGSRGFAINDSGHVTGDAAVNFTSHAFLYSSGVMTDLGTLPGATSSSGFGINNLDQVVGSSGSRAFLYTSASGMVDLNNLISNGSGWTLRAAYAINDSGQITGEGTNRRGAQHAFLLTPVSPVTVDLAIRKNAARTVASGKNLNYTIEVQNKGPNGATNVIVTDTLPSGTSFVSATPTQGSCTTPAIGSTGTVTCNLGAMASPPSGVSISLVVNVTASAGSAVTNTATVTGNVTDPNLANNAYTVSTSVNR
jgi:uncharacterized repeat protein (TIGR01451 family)